MVAATLVAAAAAALACTAAVIAWLVLSRVHSAASLSRINADEIALLHNRVDNLQTGIKRIEGRQVKAAQRSGARSDNDPPDPKTDPEGWKQWQNRAIARGKGMLQ